MENNIEDLLWEQFKIRVFEESIPRIFKCLDQLDQNQIWQKPSPNLSSVGNLVLHLEGNARQWILAALYNQPDTRKRSAEFEEGHDLTKDELKNHLSALQYDLTNAMNHKVDLSKTYHPQVFTENGVSILVHVIEHFSYHTGQIALLTKQMTGNDLKFYGGMDLG